MSLISNKIIRLIRRYNPIPNKERNNERDLANNIHDMYNNRNDFDFDGITFPEYIEEFQLRALRSIKFHEEKISYWADKGFVSEYGYFKLYWEFRGCSIVPYFLINDRDTQINHYRVLAIIEDTVDTGYDENCTGYKKQLYKGYWYVKLD